MKYIAIQMIAVFLFTLQSLNAQNSMNDQENSLVWKFYKTDSSLQKTDTSFIYGTIHIPVKSAFKVVDTVLTFMEKVDKVYFELDLDPAKMMQNAMLFMAKDSTDQVKYLLNQEDYKLLHQKANELLSPQETLVIDLFKPFGIVSLFLQKKIPSDTALAMDMAFYNYAKQLQKEIEGLETMEAQMAVFDKMSVVDKKQLLHDLLYKEEDQMKEFNDLLDAYLAQDLVKIKQVVDSSFSVEKHLSEQDLLTDRNLKMAETIDRYSTNNSALIGVGAAHLVGERGLLSLLKQRGYVLEPIKKDQ